jgi:anti-sigma factor (TIGR02949 family)
MSGRGMTCEEVLARVLDFIDGESPPGEHTKLEDHLESCRSCFSRAEFERRLKGRLTGLAHEESPPDLQHRILRLLKNFE